jgi:hypothetical protein
MRRIEMAGLFPRNVLIKAFCPLRGSAIARPAAAPDRPRSPLPTPAEIVLRARPRGTGRDSSWRIIVHRYSSRRNLAPRPISGKAPLYQRPP